MISDFLWNDDGIRDNEWKDGKTIFTNTFHHIRYGKKGEDLYAKLGVLDSVTLGHGFIMRRYSNWNLLLLPENGAQNLTFS